MNTATLPRTRGEKSIVADEEAAQQLVTFLEGEQDKNGQTDAEFAEALGVSRNYWRQVKQPEDRRKPGPLILKGAKQLYPEWSGRIKAMIRPEIAALLD